MHNDWIFSTINYNALSGLVPLLWTNAGANLRDIVGDALGAEAEISSYIAHAFGIIQERCHTKNYQYVLEPNPESAHI